MFIEKQKFLIFGISKSGYSVAKFLLKRKASCYIYEEIFVGRVETSIKELIELGAIKVEKDEVDKILESVDVLILSPGVPINHDVCIKAKNLKKRIVGEFEFGAYFIKNLFIAITGTNGKTTTSYVLKNILEKEFSVRLLGNVGVPISSAIDVVNANDIIIAEISSFQLETIHMFMPHITCILNITPDHLERHYTMENYIFLKGKLLKNLKESEYAVLNFDDEVVKKFAEKTYAQVKWFSLVEKVDGAYVIDNKIYYNEEYILDVNKITLQGLHNLQNVLASITIAKTMGVSTKSIVDGICNFKGVKHRLEFVKEINGISFYNDSKGTNTASTINALKSMTAPTVLILGGKEKGENYDLLFNQIKNSFVTNVVVIGESKHNMIESSLKAKYYNLTVCNSFENAVKLAYHLSEQGGNVLLSPACSSFDMFENYEARGDRFCEIVESLV